MSLWYEMTLPIDSRDVDGKGVCKASALLGHLQEAATQAAEHGGFSREVITREHGAFWMLTRVWYRLERPLRWEEELTIRTWHRGGRAATLYRDYDLYVGREPVGECVSAWVLARQSDRQLLRLSGSWTTPAEASCARTGSCPGCAFLMICGRRTAAAPGTATPTSTAM